MAEEENTRSDLSQNIFLQQKNHSSKAVRKEIVGNLSLEVYELSEGLIPFPFVATEGTKLN